MTVANQPEPQLDDISAFCSTLWQTGQPERRVVAWTDSNQGGYRNTEIVDSAAQATKLICELNSKPNCNVAITPTALLPSATSHAQENFQQAQFAYVDLDACGDEPELQQSLLDRYGRPLSGGIIDAALELPICRVFPPSMIVITGTTGENGKRHKRGHIYWHLTEPSSAASELKDVLSRLIDHFCADSAVKSVTQLLRVGGTVAYGVKAGRLPIEQTRTILLPESSTDLHELSRYLDRASDSPRFSIRASKVLANGNANKLTDGREQRASALAWKHVSEFAQRNGCLPEVSDVIAGLELDWRGQCCTETPSDSSSRDYSDSEWLRGWLERKCQDKINALQDQGWADTAMQGHFGQQHEPPRFALKLSGEITLDLLQRRDRLVKGLLSRNSLAALYGAPGSLKSFVALDLAYHVASGVPGSGREVEQGAVLYVAAEAPSSIEMRWLAHPDTEELPVGFIGDAPGMITREGIAGDAAQIVERAHELEQHTGTKLALVIVDTLARTIAGGSENDSGDMTAAIRNLDYIKQQTGACVLLVHHTGKDPNAGLRGHSSLLAALDTSLLVEKDGTLNPPAVTVTVKKSKDGEDGFSFNLGTRIVEVGLDAYGEQRKTLVVDHGLEVIGTSKKPPTPNHEKMLELFSGMRTCGEGPVLISDFKEQWQTYPGATPASRARQVKGRDFEDFLERCRLVPVGEDAIDYAKQPEF